MASEQTQVIVNGQSKTVTTRTNNFDFQTYNQIMQSANSGLRLHLAIQLLADVEQTMRRFNSPFAKEMIDLVDEVRDVQTRNKAYIAKQRNTTDGKLDNENAPTGDAPQGKSYANAHGDKQESHKETPAQE